MAIRALGRDLGRALGRWSPMVQGKSSMGVPHLVMRRVLLRLVSVEGVLLVVVQAVVVLLALTVPQVCSGVAGGGGTGWDMAGRGLASELGGGEAGGAACGGGRGVPVTHYPPTHFYLSVQASVMPPEGNETTRKITAEQQSNIDQPEEKEHKFEIK